MTPFARLPVYQFPRFPVSPFPLGIPMPLTIGQKATRTMTVTPEHVKAYAAITGDYNPLHFD